MKTDLFCQFSAAILFTTLVMTIASTLTPSWLGLVFVSCILVGLMIVILKGGKR